MWALSASSALGIGNLSPFLPSVKAVYVSGGGKPWWDPSSSAAPLPACFLALPALALFFRAYAEPWPRLFQRTQQWGGEGKKQERDTPRRQQPVPAAWRLWYELILISFSGVGPSPLNWLPIASLMKDDGWRSGACLKGPADQKQGCVQKYGSHLEGTWELSGTVALGEPECGRFLFFLHQDKHQLSSKAEMGISVTLRTLGRLG